jgi:opacity protein-like surface antigen
LTNGTGICVVTGAVQAIQGTANAYFGYDLHDRYMPFVGGAGFMVSAGSLTFDIDSNNDQVDRIFKIEHNSNTGAGTELMRVQEDGRVGIGTNDPQYALHVHGTISATNIIAPTIAATNVTATGTISASNVTAWPPRWDDVRIGLGGLSAPGSAPGRVVFRGGLSCYGFDDNSTEQLNFEMQLPHGTTTNTAYGVHLHVHWTQTNAIGGANSNVVWGVEYAIANPMTLYSTTTITNWVTNGITVPFFHQIAEWPAITNNIGESSVLMGRIFREGANASDTLAGDAIGMSLDAHYPRISFGSAKEDGDY